MKDRNYYIISKAVEYTLAVELFSFVLNKDIESLKILAPISIVALFVEIILMIRKYLNLK